MKGDQEAKGGISEQGRTRVRVQLPHQDGTRLAKLSMPSTYRGFSKTKLGTVLTGRESVENQYEDQ